MTIRIGSHPANLSLFILRRRQVLEALAAERDWQVQWLDYPEGRDSGEYLHREQVDFVGTGSTPPLHSQAAGVDLTYVAASASRTQGSALLVRADSELQRIDQLRGRRVAATLGSFTDHFIAAALDRHGLGYADLQLLDLARRAGERALLEGRVDAWVALDPWLTERLAAGDVRVLGEVGDYIPNRSLFWARRAWAERRPEQMRLVYRALVENDAWVATHLEEAATLLASASDAGVTVADWRQILQRRPWGIVPADGLVLEEQNRQAELLLRVGALAPLGSPLQAVPAEILLCGV
ncbi:ABC transporter substrate-binding protein [Pseudomonas oryzihabitans]|uniref:ABC transporter substrate-binding protein n=1 Tax=Pseudomonas oryzihabitans TaxID=47885 RepID=UPI00285F2881|nr:ABC transporter substrate-binding protein [Pseudomonas psychrotolerans]MDR6679202.1 sulfonate transport system substrate-binding protein [Pseudomonas psychrotolerans]